MSIIRKFMIFFFAACLPAIFASCGNRVISPYSSRQIGEIIVSTQSGTPALRQLLPEDGYFADYLSNSYQFKEDALEDGVIYYANGMEVSEIAVFLLADSTDAKEIEDSLSRYIKQRSAAFTGYAPKQAAIAEDGVVVVRGDYVALLICEDTRSAESAFLECFSDNPPALPTSQARDSSEALDKKRLLPSAAKTEPPATTGEADINGVYEPDKILSAWNSGHVNDLTDKNHEIFDACAMVIGSLISDDMTDSEKELAIHDWIVVWADYDEAAVSNAPDAQPDPDNENPYGLLIHKKATCKGYTLTFQLFMDLLGIECVTVDGTSGEGESAHSWNMVRLEDEWYCVDVTWDDPVGSRKPSNFVSREYFNVTSEFLRENDHQWDKSSVPEATDASFEYRVHMRLPGEEGSTYPEDSP